MAKKIIDKNVVDDGLLSRTFRNLIENRYELSLKSVFYNTMLVVREYFKSITLSFLLFFDLMNLFLLEIPDAISKSISKHIISGIQSLPYIGNLTQDTVRVVAYCLVLPLASLVTMFVTPVAYATTFIASMVGDYVFGLRFSSDADNQPKSDKRGDTPVGSENFDCSNKEAAFEPALKSGTGVPVKCITHCSAI